EQPRANLEEEERDHQRLHDVVAVYVAEHFHQRGAGVAPSPGMSCDRHKFSTSNVRETQPHSERTPMILPRGDGLDGTIVFIEPPSQTSIQQRKFSTNARD